MDEVEIRGALARGYCHEGQEHKIMDPDLCEAQAKEVAAILPDGEHISPQAAMAALSSRFRADDDYALGWHSNLAVMLTDYGVPYDAAQEQAAGFMRRAFNIDTLPILSRTL